MANMVYGYSLIVCSVRASPSFSLSGGEEAALNCKSKLHNFRFNFTSLFNTLKNIDAIGIS